MPDYDFNKSPPMHPAKAMDINMMVSTAGHHHTSRTVLGFSTAVAALQPRRLVTGLQQPVCFDGSHAAASRQLHGYTVALTGPGLGLIDRIAVQSTSYKTPAQLWPGTASATGLQCHLFGTPLTRPNRHTQAEALSCVTSAHPPPTLLLPTRSCVMAGSALRRSGRP
jgi:hypothetical protein